MPCLNRMLWLKLNAGIGICGSKEKSHASWHSFLCSHRAATIRVALTLINESLIPLQVCICVFEEISTFDGQILRKNEVQPESEAEVGDGSCHSAIAAKGSQTLQVRTNS